MIDVTEGRIPGRQSLITRSGILFYSRGLVWCHRLDNLLYFVDVHVVVEKELFRNRIFPRDKSEIVFFTPELLGHGADVLNCIFTNVNKEIIEFVGHNIYVLCKESPWGRSFRNTTANRFPHDISVVSVIFNLFCHEFLFS